MLPPSAGSPRAVFPRLRVLVRMELIFDSVLLEAIPPVACIKTCRTQNGGPSSVKTCCSGGQLSECAKTGYDGRTLEALVRAFFVAKGNASTLLWTIFRSSLEKRWVCGCFGLPALHLCGAINNRRQYRMYC